MSKTQNKLSVYFPWMLSLIMLALSPKNVSAGDLWDGDFKYNYLFDNDLTLIDYASSMPNRVTGIPQTIRAPKPNMWGGSNMVDFRVIAIGRKAFKDCTRLLSIEIPDRIEWIGGSAFQGCTSLEDIELTGSYLTSIGDSVFSGCTSLDMATIGAKVSIGQYAFSGCSNLNLIKLYSTSIGAGAFKDCVNLTAIKIPNSEYKASLAAEVFQGCVKLNDVELPNNISKIGASAFQDCAGLTDIKLPNSLADIDVSAFQGCTGLTDIELPNTLKNLGASAFQGCTGLTDIALPDSITNIGGSAFRDCFGLTAMTIPSSVKTLGSRAFMNCGNLTSVAFAEGQYDIEIESLERLFVNSPIKEIFIGRNFWSGRFETRELTSLTIGNLVWRIPDAFAGLSSLKSVTFGSRFDYIGSDLFKGCGLGKVVIPANVTSIGNGAFDSNDLKELIIGSGIKKIGENVFANNDDIATICVTAPVPPIVSDNTFSVQKAKLFVVPEAKEAYAKAEVWKQFEIDELIVPDKVKLWVNKESELSNFNEVAEPKKLQLIATIEPVNASLSEYIFWSSSNPDVATVDNNGVVTFKGAENGTAEITAHTLYENVLATGIVDAEGKIISGIEERDVTLSVDDILNGSSTDANRFKDIYDIHGVCLKRNASQSDIDALSPGLYIIGGRKVLIR